MRLLHFPGCRSMKAAAPETYKELERWRSSGLIQYNDGTSVDKVVAEVLATVRRLTDGAS